MLELHNNLNGEKVIVTLNELRTLNDPFFLFIFEHVLTKEIVSIIYAASDDESEWSYRYNQFNIDSQTIFSNKPIGEWHYKIYEQVSNTNTNPLLSENLLEKGKLYLYSSSEFVFEKYEPTTTYKTYGG